MPEDYFEIEEFREFPSADQLNTASLNNSLLQVAQNPEMLNALSNVYNNTLETIRFCEQQKTQRQIITTQSNERIAEINKQRDFLLGYLDKTFDERKYQFSKYFEALDKAMAKNDIQQMALCLNGISSLASSSPFRPLLEAQQYYREVAAGKRKLDF